MSSKLKNTQSNFLLKTEVALTNVLTNAEIAAEMEEFGYDSEKINEGNNLLQQAKAAVASQQVEINEKSIASLNFQKTRDELEGYYTAHRKKALLAFMDSPEISRELKIDSAPSSVFSRWRDDVNHFYTILSAKTAYKDAVAKVRLKAEDITAAKSLIPTLDTAYADFKRETGESEESTRKKNEAIAALEQYMRRFWKTAPIALEDEPQLLESLMKNRKS